jgi:nicotinate-nucleotide pyrophosphorylase (carboxylating)
MEFDASCIDGLIDLALREDIGEGDLTTQACVNGNLRAEAAIVSGSAGVISGQSVARLVFKKLDVSMRFTPLAVDGSSVSSGSRIATVTGGLSSILTGERTALNFLMRLSGIATYTRKFTELTANTRVRILDTRKTSPGLRLAEKHAVVCGNGSNHRKGLYDMILIKDNHIRASGSLPAAMKRCSEYLVSTGRNVPVEVEVGSAVELDQAIECKARWIMLDNMSLAQIRESVTLIRSKLPDCKIEVSGGVTVENVRDIADCGVDYVSVGAITHSAPALDLSLDIIRVFE